MYAKKYASVIQGLKTMLDMQDKNEVRLDYNLLSNLTFSILNEKTLHDTKEGEKKEEEEAKQVHLDEDLFDHLNEVLSGLEEKLDDEYEDEAEEESKEKEVTENDRQFLIKKLTELFDQIQKKVALRSVSES
mgnify:CR=1 FL=1|jgi:hypothetical protein